MFAHDAGSAPTIAVFPKPTRINYQTHSPITHAAMPALSTATGFGTEEASTNHHTH